MSGDDLISTKDDRKGSWNKLTAQSSTSKLVKLKQGISCVRENTRVCTHMCTISQGLPHPTVSAQHQQEESLEISFYYQSPVYWQSMSWFPSVRHLARVLYSAKARWCVVVSQVPYVTKVWGTRISFSTLCVFSLTQPHKLSKIV